MNTPGNLKSKQIKKTRLLNEDGKSPCPLRRGGIERKGVYVSMCTTGAGETPPTSWAIYVMMISDSRILIGGMNSFLIEIEFPLGWIRGKRRKTITRSRINIFILFKSSPRGTKTPSQKWHKIWSRKSNKRIRCIANFNQEEKNSPWAFACLHQSEYKIWCWNPLDPWIPEAEGEVGIRKQVPLDHRQGHDCR